MALVVTLVGLTTTVADSFSPASVVHRSIFKALILSLFAWSAVLGSPHALLICLHADGAGHLLTDHGEAVEAIECCHDDRHGGNVLSLQEVCHECDDVAVDFAAVNAPRPEDDSWEKPVATDYSEGFDIPGHYLRHDALLVWQKPARAPPITPFQNLLIARTTVLRI